jgi:hypothetical protein
LLELLEFEVLESKKSECNEADGDVEEQTGNGLY